MSIVEPVFIKAIYFTKSKCYSFDYIFELTDKSRARWLSFFLKGRIKVADGTNINLNPIWKLVFNDILVFDQTLTHTVEKDYRIIKKYFPVPE